MIKLLFFLIGVSLALTQTAAQGQTTVLVAMDSLRMPPLLSPQYDFYYSARQADAFTRISIASYALEDRLKRNRFRDKTYTALVDKGLPVRDGFDDYVLIGSGTIEEVKPDGYW